MKRKPQNAAYIKLKRHFLLFYLVPVLLFASILVFVLNQMHQGQKRFYENQILEMTRVFYFNALAAFDRMEVFVRESSDIVSSKYPRYPATSTRTDILTAYEKSGLDTDLLESVTIFNQNTRAGEVLLSRKDMSSGAGASQKSTEAESEAETEAEISINKYFQMPMITDSGTASESYTIRKGIVTRFYQGGLYKKVLCLTIPSGFSDSVYLVMDFNLDAVHRQIFNEPLIQLLSGIYSEGGRNDDEPYLVIMNRATVHQALEGSASDWTMRASLISSSVGLEFPHEEFLFQYRHYRDNSDNQQPDSPFPLPGSSFNPPITLQTDHYFYICLENKKTDILAILYTTSSFYRKQSTHEDFMIQIVGLFIGAALLTYLLLLLFVRKKLEPLNNISEVLENSPEAYNNPQSTSGSELLALRDKIIATQIEQKQAQIMSLQNQINPHFLYNTLDSIRGAAIINDIPIIAEMAKRLSLLFRYSTQKEIIVPLKSELTNIQDYLTIQNFRHGNKFNLMINCPAYLGAYAILRLTLQPLIENSIKHGLEPKTEKGTIHIDVSTMDALLKITITDDGKGIPPSKVDFYNSLLSQPVNKTFYSDSGSIGITNVNSRIKLYYGQKYGVRLLKIPEGTCIEITLPAIPEGTGK